MKEEKEGRKGEKNISWREDQQVFGEYKRKNGEKKKELERKKQNVRERS